ncbi:unnamed protein product [Prorocentrum cordatum]|uniref:Uncharacterized protein n=1 Tax=Prorocentrum cordatum TaxID=2364126 RepID=A0ABN9RKB8_9DINO|nr:unnamed protein product [Polarella glacialis]
MALSILPASLFPNAARGLIVMTDVAEEVGSAAGRIVTAGANVSTSAAKLVSAVTDGSIGLVEAAWRGVDLLDVQVLGSTGRFFVEDEDDWPAFFQEPEVQQVLQFEQEFLRPLAWGLLGMDETAEAPAMAEQLKFLADPSFPAPELDLGPEMREQPRLLETDRTAYTGDGYSLNGTGLVSAGEVPVASAGPDLLRKCCYMCFMRHGDKPHGGKVYWLRFIEYAIEADVRDDSGGPGVPNVSLKDIYDAVLKDERLGAAADFTTAFAGYNHIMHALALRGGPPQAEGVGAVRGAGAGERAWERRGWWGSRGCLGRRCGRRWSGLAASLAARHHRAIARLSRPIAAKGGVDKAGDEGAMLIEQSWGRSLEGQVKMIDFGHGAADQEGSQSIQRTANLAPAINTTREKIKLNCLLEKGTGSEGETRWDLQVRVNGEGGRLSQAKFTGNCVLAMAAAAPQTKDHRVCCRRAEKAAAGRRGQQVTARWRRGAPGRQLTARAAFAPSMWPWLADRGASLALGYLGCCPAAPSCPPCPSCSLSCARVACPAAPPCPACPAGAFSAAAPQEAPAAPRGPQAPPTGPCPEPAPCAGGSGGWWIFLLGLIVGVLLSVLACAAWRAAVAAARALVAPRARPDAPALADELPAAAAVPDLSIQFIDVTTHRVIPLTRDLEFPRRVRGEAYAFDPLTPEELQQVRREAKELLAVYGLTGGADAQPEGGRWLIADPAHPGFGDALPAAALADADSLIIRGDRGLACVDEDWLAVDRVLDEDLDIWRLLKKSTGAGRDRRILGDERANGVPMLSLTAAARASSKALRLGWPFRGDACAPELVMALVAAGIVFITHHLDWRTKLGVSTTSGVCRTHRRICEGLDQAICYDQLDFANCAVIEHLARWLYEVMESAVRRNPKVPDFTNLDGIFAAPMAEDGRMQLPTFSKWVSSLRRDEAQIMKQDGFYQFANDDLADWFGFNYPEAAPDFGGPLVHIPADGRFVQVSSDTRIFAVFRGLLMGWSWSLFFCQDLLEEAQCKGLLSLGCEGGGRLVHERCPAPLLAPGCPLSQPYVDNANVIGLSRRDTEHALRGIQHVLDYLGIDYHDLVEPTKLYTTVGVVLDTAARRLRHAGARAWRLYLGVEHLLRVRRASGRALRVVRGHLVNHFMITRPALAALDEGYRFIAQHLDERAPLGRLLLDELRVVKGLLLLADVDLAAPWSRVVYCSDASGGELRGWAGWPFAVAGNGGYALHETACVDYEVMQAFRYRERWRFKMEEEELVMPGAPSDAIRGWAPEPTATSDLLIVGLLAPSSKPSVIDRRLPRTRTVIVQGAVPALDDALLVRSRWKMIVRGAFKYKASIHVKEARTQLLGLVRASRDPRMHGLRVGSLGDDMAALLRFEKGRARDRALLQLCQVSAARQIGCEIQWKQRYCESGRNPTDADSRAADLGHVLPDHPQRGCSRALTVIESANAGLATEPAGPLARVRRPAPCGPAAGLLPGGAAACLARVGAFARRRPPRAGAVHGRPSPELPRAAPQAPRRGQPCQRAHGGRSRCRAFCELYAGTGSFKGFELRVLPYGCYGYAISAAYTGGNWALLHYCQYGCACKKPTYLVSSLPEITSLERLCQGNHSHDILQGKVSLAPPSGAIRSHWKTSLAGACPPELCRRWARLLAACAPRAARCAHAGDPLGDHWETELAANFPGGGVQPQRPQPSCPSGSPPEWPAPAPQWGAAWPYLKHQRVQPRTVALHREARRKFSQWAAEQHLRRVSMDETDLVMTRYLDHMHFQGLSIVHARNAVHGAIFVKEYPRQSPTTMYRAKDALAGWFKAGPDRVRDPLPWEAAVLIADNLAERDREGVAAAGALLVSFDGYIRPSNTLAITSRLASQRQAGSNPNYPSLVVTIAPQADDHGQQPAPSTKSGDHDCTIVFGDQASLKANRGICRDALLWASRKARRGRPLFDISLAKYEQLFNQAVSDVKLSSLRVAPHCARHGGPSSDAALKLRPLEAIQKRGLWRSASTVRRYEKHGTLMRQIAKMTSSQLRSVPAVGTGITPYGNLPLRKDGNALDPKVMDCLRLLAKDPLNSVVVISGRSPEFLDRVGLSQVEGLGLCAEYGFYYQDPGRIEKASRAKGGGSEGSDRWKCSSASTTDDADWKEIVFELMKMYAKRVQGSIIEYKGAAISWNYREVGAQILAKEMALQLMRFLDPEEPDGLMRGYPVTVAAGKGYVEVGRSDINKGISVKRMLAEIQQHIGNLDFVLCIGDDRSDEHMFEAVSEYRQSKTKEEKRSFNASTNSLGALSSPRFGDGDGQSLSGAAAKQMSKKASMTIEALEEAEKALNQRRPCWDAQGEAPTFSRGDKITTGGFGMFSASRGPRRAMGHETRPRMGNWSWGRGPDLWESTLRKYHDAGGLRGGWARAFADAASIRIS